MILIEIAIFLCFIPLFSTETNAASTLVLPIQNFDNTYNIISSNLRYRFFVKCYSESGFSGSTNEQVWYLATTEETKSFTSGTYTNCKSFKIHGFGIDAPQWSNQMQTTGKYIFQTTLSMSFGYFNESLQRVTCETAGEDGISCYQAYNRGNAPLYLLATNNWTKSSDVSRWLNYGYKTQVNFGTIASDFEPVDSVDSYTIYGTSSISTVYARKLFNLTLTGYGENAYNISPFTNNTFALFVGDIIDANNYILEVGQANDFNFTVSKGPFMLMHDSAMTDLVRNRLLQQIDQHIQNLSNTQVVNRLDLLRSEEQRRYESEQQAENQRLDTVMNDNTASSEGQLASFMTSFDDGSDPTLVSIVTKPLAFVQAMVNSACTPLVLPLPFVNSDLTLPCGRAYVSQFAAPLISIWDVISVGLIAYSISVDLFIRIRKMKNPDDSSGGLSPIDL